jgi:ribonuclease G
MPSYVPRIKLYEGRRPIFDHFGIEEALRSALHRNVPLKSGGSLVIEQGEALTAIDVNTGSFVGEADLETTITQNNIEACHAVADQLRLRNVGGIIVIDFVDMENPNNRKKVWDEFQKALNADSQRSNVTKISELGLVEMTRKRSRESLKQLLAMPCPCCEGRGYIKSTTTIAHEILREVRRVGPTLKAAVIEIVCAPDVADLLNKYERDFLDDLEKRFHKKVEVKKSGSLQPDQYRVAGQTIKDEEPSKKPPQRSGRGRNGRSRRRRDREAANRETTAPPTEDDDDTADEVEVEETADV